MTRGKPRLGLVLGGGGVRGLAHVGVLHGLSRAGVEPDVLVGVSMGALVAVTYAARADWREALEALDRSRLPRLEEARDDVALLRMRSLVRNARRLVPSVWVWGRQGYEDYGRTTLATLLGDVRTFADTRIPVAVTATDLAAGRRNVFTEGDLVEATLASGAIPGLTRPLLIGGRTYIDGGFADPAPVDVARDLGADVVVAVHAGQHHAPLEADNWALALLRGLEVSRRAFAEERLSHADLVLRPDFGERVHVLDFSAAEEVVRRGAACAREEIDAILALVDGAR